MATVSPGLTKNDQSIRCLRLRSDGIGESDIVKCHGSQCRNRKFGRFAGRSHRGNLIQDFGDALCTRPAPANLAPDF